MMWKICRGLLLAAIVSALSCALVRAAGVHVDLDLTDFDDDSMRDMDDANKDLQPVLGAKNAQAALADVQVIQNVLKETEAYFTKKGGTENAVKIAQDGEASVAAVIAALERKDFDAAAAAARDTARNCRACHDIYKPLTK
jgi:predicted metal-dependent phosphotriesterase family hydrolase